MKLKYKVVLDVIMAAFIIIVFQYDITGGLLHEIAGFVLIGAFMAHLLINKRYYAAIKKILTIKNGNKVKKIVQLILNIILICCMAIILVSSVCISRDIMPFVGDSIGGYAIWRLVHVVCAYVMLSIVFAHVIMHWNMIINTVFKRLRETGAVKIADVSMRVIAGIMAVVIVKISVESVAESVNILGTYYEMKKNTVVSQYSYEYENESNNDEKIAEEATTEAVITDTGAAITTTEAETKENLNDYLSKLTCTGCSKHCSLLNPQCSKGMTKQATAISTYNNM